MKKEIEHGVYDALSMWDSEAGARTQVNKFGATWPKKGEPVLGIAKVQVTPKMTLKPTGPEGHYSVWATNEVLMANWQCSLLCDQ